MPAPTPDTGIEARGVLHARSQFDDSPRQRRFLEILLDETQQLEDHRAAVASALRIGGATGVWLDYWGERVGEQRGVFSDDDEYRRVIRARALANRSKWGHPETIIGIVQELAQPDAIFIAQAGQLWYELAYEIASPPLPTRFRDKIIEFLGLANHHCVGCDIVEAETGATFRYNAPPGLGYNSGAYASLIGQI